MREGCSRIYSVMNQDETKNSDDLCGSKMSLAGNYVSPESGFILSRIGKDHTTLPSFHITHPLWLSALHECKRSRLFAPEHHFCPVGVTVVERRLRSKSPAMSVMGPALQRTEVHQLSSVV